jgi:hypothetical protein
MHGIGKIKNVPVIECDQIKENKNLINNAICYIDSLITTINPEIYALILRQYSCQKGSNKIVDDEQDYIELVNKL